MKKFCIAAFILTTAFSAAFSGRILADGKGLKMYGGQQDTTAVLDTMRLVHTRIKAGFFGKEIFKFSFDEGDTILFKVEKEVARTAEFKVIGPSGEILYNLHWDDQSLLEGGFVTTEGAYSFYFKNKSWKKNYFNIALKRVKRKPKPIVIKPDPEPEPEPEPAPVVFDTVPEIIIDTTCYIGAKLNIKSQGYVVIPFEFKHAAAPGFWTYVVGSGRNYADRIKSVTDPLTQQPVGDALVAFGMGTIRNLPASESKHVTFDITSSNLTVIKGTTGFGKLKAEPGKYFLTIKNSDEVVGKYIYVKIVKFSMEPGG